MSSGAFSKKNQVSIPSQYEVWAHKNCERIVECDDKNFCIQKYNCAEEYHPTSDYFCISVMIVIAAALFFLIVVRRMA